MTAGVPFQQVYQREIFQLPVEQALDVILKLAEFIVGSSAFFKLNAVKCGPWTLRSPLYYSDTPAKVKERTSCVAGQWCVSKLL